MAHSIEKYGEKLEIFNDIDLLIFIGFAIKIVNQVPEFAGLQDLNGQWEKSLPAYGSGVIDLQI